VHGWILNPQFSQAQQKVVNSTPPPSSVFSNLLALKGISGPPAHRLAIINDQTMGQGETANVKVGGQRVRVKCVEIRERAAIVMIADEQRPIQLLLQ